MTVSNDHSIHSQVGELYLEFKSNHINFSESRHLICQLQFSRLKLAEKKRKICRVSNDDSQTQKSQKFDVTVY